MIYIVTPKPKSGVITSEGPFYVEINEITGMAKRFKYPKQSSWTRYFVHYTLASWSDDRYVKCTCTELAQLLLGLE